MLAKLVGGLCIDPEIVKVIYVKREPVKQGQKDMVWSVNLRTDGDQELRLAAPETEEEAVAISRKCADLVNKALKGDDEEEEEDSDEEEEEEKEEEDGSSSEDERPVSFDDDD